MSQYLNLTIMKTMQGKMHDLKSRMRVLFIGSMIIQPEMNPTYFCSPRIQANQYRTRSFWKSETMCARTLRPIFRDLFYIFYLCLLLNPFWFHFKGVAFLYRYFFFIKLVALNRKIEKSSQFKTQRRNETVAFRMYVCNKCVCVCQYMCICFLSVITILIAYTEIFVGGFKNVIL